MFLTWHISVVFKRNKIRALSDCCRRISVCWPSAPFYVAFRRYIWSQENTVAVPRKQHHGGGFKSVGCQTVVGCDNMKCSMASDELRIHRAGMHTISVGTLHKAIDDFSLMLRYWPTKPQQSGGESRDGPSAANAPAPLTPVLRDDAGPPGPVRSTHSAESHTPVRRDDAGPPGPSRSTHSAALQQQQPWRPDDTSPRDSTAKTVAKVSNIICTNIGLIETNTSFD